MSYPYEQPQQQQPAPKPGMSTGKKIALFGCLPATLLGVLAFGGCLAVGGAALNEASKSVERSKADDKRAAEEDVELLSCELVDEEFGGKDVKAKIKFTNHGKKRADYFVKGEYLDQKGNKVDELLASVDDLEPGKSSTQNFGGLITSDQLAHVTKGECKILDVTRSEWSASN